MNEMSKPAAIKGEEHWTSKDGGVKLFLFEKCAGDPANSVGTILFVHGSSMASQPTFDLQVPGRPYSSAMDYFASLGFDCWCLDMEGYGRSTKDRDNNAPISQGADDCYAAALYIQKLRGKRPFLVYGISSGAQRAAMFAERHHLGVALGEHGGAQCAGGNAVNQERPLAPQLLDIERRRVAVVLSLIHISE